MLMLNNQKFDINKPIPIIPIPTIFFKFFSSLKIAMPNIDVIKGDAEENMPVMATPTIFIE